MVEIPSFRIFPAYFEIREEEMIDLHIEFKPESSGTHVENIIIACNNGETRMLDLIGDGIAWHSYYITIQVLPSLMLSIKISEDISIDPCRIPFLKIFPWTLTMT